MTSEWGKACRVQPLSFTARCPALKFADSWLLGKLSSSVFSRLSDAGPALQTGVDAVQRPFPLGRFPQKLESDAEPVRVICISKNGMHTSHPVPAALFSLRWLKHIICCLSGLTCDLSFPQKNMTSSIRIFSTQRLSTPWPLHVEIAALLHSHYPKMVSPI